MKKGQKQGKVTQFSPLDAESLSPDILPKTKTKTNTKNKQTNKTRFFFLELSDIFAVVIIIMYYSLLFFLLASLLFRLRRLIL